MHSSVCTGEKYNQNYDTNLNCIQKKRKEKKTYVSERNALYLYSQTVYIFCKWFAMDKLYVFACGTVSVLYTRI